MCFIADPERLRAVGPLDFCATGADVDFEVEVCTCDAFLIFFLSHAVGK
jgi:hypothetical protein